MQLYESVNGERSQMTVSSGEFYVVVTTESDNGQTSQHVEVLLDIGQAMQLREQLDHFIKGT